MRLSERMKRKKHPGLQATEIGVTQGFLSRNMQNPKTAEAVAGSSLSNDSETPAVLEADDLLSEDLEPKKRAHEMTDGHSLINLNDETGKTPVRSSIDEELLKDEVEAPESTVNSFWIV